MNEKQKTYTINEINKYNKEIGELYYGINRSTLLSTCGAALAVAIIVMNGGEFSGNEIIDNFVSLASVGASVGGGISAVRKIVERAGLKQTIRQLEHDVAMSDLEYTQHETMRRVK